MYFLLTGQPHFEPAKTVQDFYLRILQQEPIRIDKRRADLPMELANIACLSHVEHLRVIESSSNMNPWDVVTRNDRPGQRDASTGIWRSALMTSTPS